jgi:hypothetical protein
MFFVVLGVGTVLLCFWFFWLLFRMVPCFKTGLIVFSEL